MDVIGDRVAVTLAYRSMERTQPMPKKRPKSSTKARVTTKKRAARKTSSKKSVAAPNRPEGSFTMAFNAPVVQVIVARAVSAGGLLSAQLNGSNLVFQNDVAHAVVAAGQSNTLARRVVGPAGTKWRVAVTQPQGTGCDNSGTLDASGREAGTCVFSS